MAPTFDPDACRQRNRLAARRDGIDAAPLRFLAGAEVETLPQPPVDSLARFPQSRPEALVLINARSSRPLTDDDVFVHYAEAANNNFIESRFMFLDASTLRNIAADGRSGVSFMNSHRSGGLSHPSELPFGQTFAGRYLADEGGQRALLGIYLLARGSDGRAVYPNGTGGPSTADLHELIEAGTISDVSVGLYGGERVCDVCGVDLAAVKPGTEDAWAPEYLCPHAPGTTRKMSTAQVEAQTGRGVKKGAASYSLVDSRLGEVSAVFDGAVPGAGFRKALSLCRGGDLDAADLMAAREAFASLLGKHDFEQQTSSPGGLAFTDEADAVLDAVEAILVRAGEIQRLRGVRGGRLSAGGRERLARIHAALGSFLAEMETPADTGRVLRLRAAILQRQIQRREAPTGG